VRTRLGLYSTEVAKRTEACCNGKNVEKINGLGKDLSESGCEDQPFE
jgi:hypothetical protein